MNVQSEEDPVLKKKRTRKKNGEILMREMTPFLHCQTRWKEDATEAKTRWCNFWRWITKPCAAFFDGH